MIIITNRLWDWWSDKTGFIGFTCYPFVLVDSYFLDDEILLNHESIHIEQQKELWLIPFFIMYIYYWLKNMIFLKLDSHDAYMQIPFEKEAYDRDKDFDYLKTRKKNAWKDYL